MFWPIVIMLVLAFILINTAFERNITRDCNQCGENRPLAHLINGRCRPYCSDDAPMMETP